MAANTTGQPYAYPTPQMIAEYRALVNSSGAPIAQGTATPNTSSMGAPTGVMGGIRRLKNRLAIAILGADAGSVLFPPMNPLQPIAQPPEAFAVGRPWDYPVGYNMRVKPRDGLPVSFAMLRNLALPGGGYDVLRLLIERMKDKLVSEEWSIAPRDKKQKRDKQCDDLEDWLAYPDRRHTWRDWMRMVLEQVFVYDALSIYVRRDRGGDVYSCEVQDGTLITPKIGPDGIVPLPEFGPAYQKILKGLPAADFVMPMPFGETAPLDPSTGLPFPELLYKPRNLFVDRVYGMSPVEQMITTVQIALSRETFLQSFYSQGSMPDLLISVPTTWSTAQTASFKTWWDSVLEGNLQARRGAMFVPDGVKPFNMKEGALTDETDQWLIRVMCFAFGLNPMPFIKSMNRGQEKTHHQEAVQEGLEPWQKFCTDFIDTLIMLKTGRADLTFRWREDDPVEPLEQAQIDQILVNAKIYHPDELRAKRGDDSMSPEMRAQMDMATFNAAVNSTVLPPEQQAEADQRSQDMAEHAAALAPKPDASPEDKAKKIVAEMLEKMAAVFKQPAPVINVHSPDVHVAPAAITVNTPDVRIDAPVTVHTPDVKQADVFVDVGAVNLQNKVEPAATVGKSLGGTRTVTASRDEAGNLVGTITESVKRTVTATRDADGNLVAKVVS